MRSTFAFLCWFYSLRSGHALPHGLQGMQLAAVPRVQLYLSVLMSLLVGLLTVAALAS